ncbi:MAG TPA: MFS transporter [Blastocatellia bacterium]|jgi:fucose permease|nr:MFS transporter [Blastocatellia bacterium]
MFPAARRTTLLLHAGFVLTGVVTTLLGPVLPALTEKWSIDDAQAGYLFTAQFAGSIAGVIASSRMMARFGSRGALASGFALASAGVAGLGASPWIAGIACVFMYGTGLGLTIPTTNLLISEANPNRRAAALNVLNFAWGIGAVASPPIIGPLARRSTLWPLLALAALVAAVALWLARSSLDAAGGNSGQAVDERQSARRPFLTPFLLLLGAMAFFYVGTENALGGWVATYALRFDPAGRSSWAAVPSVFWGALLAGRIMTPIFLRHISGEKLSLAGLAVALAGVALLLAGTTLRGLLASTFLAGLGLASVFPNALATMSERFGSSASRAAGVVFTLAGLGGAIIPWLVGIVSISFGSLRLGLAVALLSGLAMAALQLAIILALPRPNGAHGRKGGSAGR